MSDSYLKSIRLALGLTQEEMASEMGLSRRAYVDAEKADVARKLHVLAAERVALGRFGNGWTTLDKLPPHIQVEIMKIIKTAR